MRRAAAGVTVLGAVGVAVFVGVLFGFAWGGLVFSGSVVLAGLSSLRSLDG